jgi:predicted nucleotidyltransferase component of viral defense system
MKGYVSQEIFNQVREARIIEVLQGVARSEMGRSLAFKGGTALRLFWDLPRYSEDLDFAALGPIPPKRALESFIRLGRENGYEVTDSAVKRQTVLCEYRFRWEGPNFHLKAEVSLRGGKPPVEIRSLRGVPVVVMREDRLVAEKLRSFLDRDAARDAFDLWFILDKRLEYSAGELSKACGSPARFFRLAHEKLERLNRRRLVNEVGKLLDARLRGWLKTSFVEDLDRLLKAKAAL